MKGRGYRGRTVHNYFFSRKPDSPIYTLNIHNIKTIFSKNELFLERIKRYYRWSLSLALNENSYPPFNIVRLLNKSTLSENNFN